jgi:endonuclease III
MAGRSTRGRPAAGGDGPGSPPGARPPAGARKRAVRGSLALRERAAALLEALRRARPEAAVELEHQNPFQLLIATILSAQCTDARVNLVTRDLFRRYPDPAALARARTSDLERMIRSTGFFRAKARSIRECSREILARHSGEVPRAIEDLTRLPGVGRKTANVVLGAGYGIASGIVVDTHMARVARRLGLTRATDPIAIERDLMRLIPDRDWIFFSIAMVLHGRYVCVARRPRCGACALSSRCPSRDLGLEGGPAARRARPGPRPARRAPD